MAVDTKLEEWKSDFSAEDDNTPDDEAVIGTTLGNEFRSLKELTKKDLSNSQDFSAADPIVYTSTAMPDPGTGKPYSLRKSVTPTQLEADANIAYDVIATGLGSQDSDSMVGYSFQIMGDLWGEALYAGTPLCISSDGFKKFASLEITKITTEDVALADGYIGHGPATEVSFHPQLVPFPRHTTEVCASSIEFEFVDGLNNLGAFPSLELKVTGGVVLSDFKCAVLKGRRIQIIRMEKVDRSANAYPTNEAGDPDEYYPNGSFTVVMNGDSRNDGALGPIGGPDRYIGLYTSAKDLAAEVDGMSETKAEDLFGSSVNETDFPDFGIETFSNMELPDSTAWNPSPGAGSTPVEDELDTKYVMRMSNEDFLTDPTNSSETIATPDSAYYLIGTQKGNLALNGQKYDTVSFSVIQNGAAANEVFEWVFPDNMPDYPPSYLGMQAAVPEDRGRDFRATVTCVKVKNAPTSFELTTNIAHPIVSMNEWSGTNWDALTPANRNRRFTSFKLQFPEAFDSSIEITYDVTIFSPSLNGKTFYTRDNESA